MVCLCNEGTIYCSENNYNKESKVVDTSDGIENEVIFFYILSRLCFTGNNPVMVFPSMMFKVEFGGGAAWQGDVLGNHIKCPASIGNMFPVDSDTHTIFPRLPILAPRRCCYLWIKPFRWCQ